MKTNSFCLWGKQFDVNQIKYFFCITKKAISWASAERWCQIKYSAHLASILNEDEMTDVTKMAMIAWPRVAFTFIGLKRTVSP